MKATSRRRLRWLAPAGSLAVIALSTAVPHLVPAGADPIPTLPPLTTAQLLDKVRAARVDTLSGDVRFTADIGLPDLGALGIGGGGTGSFLDLLTGSRTAHVWYDGPEHVRVALDGAQSESDWIRNGRDVWSWDSNRQEVHHATLPPLGTGGRSPVEPLPGVDPVGVAGNLLTWLDPTTAVSVESNSYVADRPVYELVLAPRSKVSTIADAVVSVDAATGLPLAVRMDARSGGAPVFELTFTSLSFDRPDASRFTFTPPPGASVVEASDPLALVPLGLPGSMGGFSPRGARPQPDPGAGGRPSVRTVGTAWETVAVVSGLDLAGPLNVLFHDAPSVSVGARTGHLVTTRVVNALVLDDGRLVMGAVTTDALVAAAQGR